MHLAGRRITVMGLGRHGGGVAAVRFLVGEGAEVTLTDLAEETALGDSIAALGDCKAKIVRWRLGGHDAADFSSAQSIVVNPAVRPDHPLLALARSAGVGLTSEIELFLERCPAPVIAVTGSNGKSSTATMLAGMFAAAGRRYWLGGNIGHSLLPALPAMQPADVVVLELSSFQLAHLSSAARFPQVAIVTNCTPNHLDWHGSFADYAAAKRRLVENLPSGGSLVLNPHDGESSSWLIPPGARRLAPWPLERIPPLAVAGDHQRLNAALAAAIAEAFGVDAAAIDRALIDFRALPHRQQWVAAIAGRQFVDDSKSTTPEATLAALAATAGPTWVLVGGQDKGVALQSFCQQLAARATGIACYGTLGPALGEALAGAGARVPYVVVERLDEALAWCWERSHRGDTILLSPAAASLDQFRDYAYRAEVFRAWITRQTID